MAVRLGGSAMREIRTLLDWGAMGSWSDRQLLTHLPAGGEVSEAALRVLINRHAPMVMGICRRVLGDEAAAEDAFQATFLVLVRKADSLRGHEMITNWMYAVALRAAKKERAKTARRRDVERNAAAARAAWPSEELENAELRSVIDEELALLPERYRLPVILCYLEGLRHEEIAQRLGCPLGTVESRLSRARAQLRGRLTRRGLSPTAGTLAMALSSPTDASASITLTAVAARTLEAAVTLSSTRVGSFAAPVRWLSGRVLSLAPAIQTAAVISTLVVCSAAGLAATRWSVLGAGEQPPPADRHETTTPPSSGPDIPMSGTADQPNVARAQVLTPQVEPARETPRKGQEERPTPAPTKATTGDESAKPEGSLPIPTFRAGAQVVETVKPSRAAVAYAPPLSGITIDGQLDDWPVAIARYPIDKLLDLSGAGTEGPVRGYASTSADMSAVFSIAYDFKEQLLYLAVIVRDDHIIIGHASHMDTDALEVYVDGLFGDRRLRQGLTPEEFSKLELADLPVQQYITIPGKGMIYGVRQASNPILIAGSLKNTKTRMAFTQKGDVTTYEWAIQVFDRYPDEPTRLEPGKRIGFDVAVVDRDTPAILAEGNNVSPADRSDWSYWCSLWRGNKLLDAGALGEVILMK